VIKTKAMSKVIVK